MTTPVLHTAARRLTILCATALLLAGCATQTTTGTGGGDTGAAAAGDAAAGDADTADTDAAGTNDRCPVIDGEEYFSDSMITAFPEAGQVYGDGTSVTFEGPAELYPMYTLYYVDERGEKLHSAGGGFSQTAPEGVFTTDLPVIGDEADGRPGILELETVYHDGMVLDTPNPDYVDGVSTVIVGRYCLTLKVA